MERLVAALACRNNGSRLYAKPLQNIDVENNVRVLTHIVSVLKSIPQIDSIVLGISNGSDNLIYKDLAKQYNIDYITGDEINVTQRLFDCGQKQNATDIFRVTTESPFCYFEAIASAWKTHLENKNDATFFDHVPDGSGFEIIRMSAIQKTLTSGEDRHRSELCTLFLRENRNLFKLQTLSPPQKLIRKDIRLTIDYPEDLILCREVYKKFRSKAPLIPLEDIIDYLDQRKDLLKLISPYCEEGYKTMYL